MRDVWITCHQLEGFMGGLAQFQRALLDGLPALHSRTITLNLSISSASLATINSIPDLGILNSSTFTSFVIRRDIIFFLWLESPADLNTFVPRWRASAAGQALGDYVLRV